MRSSGSTEQSALSCQYSTGSSIDGIVLSASILFNGWIPVWRHEELIVLRLLIVNLHT